MLILKHCLLQTVIAATFFLTACDPQGSARQKNKFDTDKESDDKVVVVTYDANSTVPQTFQGKADSSISSAAITIQPGSLAIGTELTIEEGGSIAAEELVESLGLEETTLEASGPAVAIFSTSNLDATQPFTIALPITDSAGLLQTTKENIVIIYKVAKEVDKGALTFGVFPTSAVTIEGDVAKIDTKWFGVYQVANASKDILTSKEVLTADPIILKSKVSDLTGRWVSNCIQETKGKTNADGTVDDPEWTIETIGFSHESINYQSVMYRDENCKTSFLRFQIGGSYVRPVVESSVELKPIDLTMKTVFVTVTNPDSLAFANNPKRKLCGQSDWQLNVPKAVNDFNLCTGSEGDSSSDSEGGCPDSGPKLGKTYYSIFSISGDTLSFGKDTAPNCGQSADTRNIELEDEPKMKQ
jgi:hypothetical protein